MNLKDLIALVRQRAKDKTKSPLWSDTDIIQALNEAQWQACRRARLIKDSTTDEVCRIDLKVNVSLYPVDDRVIFVRRVKVNSMTRPLAFRRVRDMDREVPGWEAHTGTPERWIPDYTTGQIRIYRTPDATFLVSPDFAMLTVVRGPLADMVDTSDEPEIHPRFHYKLHHHALELLYSDQDAETYDAEASAKHAAAFVAEFGPPSSATDEVWIEENDDFNEDMGVF